MSKHRLDALADGIFAVAMTLLVIELKLPEDFHPERSLDLLQVLAQLIPRFVGWVISFFVLAMFWWGQARVMHYVQRVDGRLVGLNLLLLGAASLMPFASAITGQMPKLLGGQIVYSTAMLLLCLPAFLLWRHVRRHPELCDTPLPESLYAESRFRIGALVAISIAAIAIANVIPAGGNIAFMLMIPAGRVGRRIRERHAQQE